jgi:uncharacterized lipoprotein YmbA
MMNRRPFLSHTAALLCLALLLQGGCARSGPPRFYVLHALAETGTVGEAAGIAEDITVGIGPVTLPSYLERPQIVTTAAEPEIHININEFERWAGSLKEDIGRVVAENIASMLGSNRILIYPWHRSTVDYRVQMEILRFDGALGHEVMLRVQWAVFDAAGEMPVLTVSEFQKPAAGPGVDALIEAWSLALADLSGEMAAVLVDLASRKNDARPEGRR